MKELLTIQTNGPTEMLPKSTEAPYNPFQDRKLRHPTSDWDTLVHLLKASFGSGLMAIPSAFAHAGLVFGLIATVAVGLICTYCVHILVKSTHALCKRHQMPSLGYAEVGELSFRSGPKYLHQWAPLAKATIVMFIIVDLLGTCCVYVVFTASNIRQVVEFYIEAGYDVRLHILAVLPFLIAVNMIRNLKYLTPFSMLANVLFVTGLGITFYYIFDDLPPLSSRPAIVNVTKWPMFFGTAIFALEGVGVVMSLENNMKTPTHFIGCPSVLNIGMIIIVTMYSLCGFLGYLKYGDDTKGSISLNLPEQEVLAQSVKLMIAFAIFFTYSLQFYVPMEIIWKNIKHHFTWHELHAEYMVRIVLVTLTIIVAVAVPNLGGFITLVGALCLSTLGLIFPAIIDLLTFYEDPGLGQFNWRLWKNCFLIILGIIGLITGSYTSIQYIIGSYTFL